LTHATNMLVGGARRYSLERRRGSPLSSSPVRGRDEQLDTLTGFLQRVRAGTGGVVIIEGGAGLGKTSLLAAAREAARTLEFRTGLGTAEPGHGSVLMEALFGGTDPLIDRTSLGSRDRSREEPFWLLADIQTLMERAALRRPLVVCLDDVQWADAGCGFALRMLTQWLASLPVAWLIGVRPDQGAAQVQRALAELTAAGATTIPLTPLAASAVAEVAKDVLGVPAGGDLLRTLAEARGNPFLIVDLLAGPLDRLPGVLDEIVLRPVLAGDPDHLGGQPMAPLQLVQGPEGLLLGQVAGDAEDH